MLKCRGLDDASRGKIKDHASAHGLEAVIAGAAIHLRAEDFVAPSPYEYFIRSIRGAPLQARASILTQAENGRGETSPASNQLHLAAGIALACKLMGKSCVTLCMSNMAQSADFWRSAVSFASNRKLPVVFVLANPPGKNQSLFAELRNQAQELLPAITVDGNDVVAVYRVAEESTRRARQGLGPSLIECRLEAGRDPLVFMETYLKNRGLWSDGWKQELIRNLERELASPQRSRRRSA
ncbi:MAG: thiamine pyrophosphate-dependent enzyme [Actinomycetota bacterium]